MSADCTIQDVFSRFYSEYTKTHELSPAQRKAAYDDATLLVEQYNRDLAAWERQVHREQQPQQKPPEKESIRKKLRDMEAEAKRRNDARRQQTRPRCHIYDRGR